MDFTENELAVKNMRAEGMTLREIGKQLGVTAERVRQINLAYYRKCALNRDISQNWGMLKHECVRLGIDQNHLVRMIRILKRNGFNTIRNPNLADEQFVGEMRGMGAKYTEAIVSAANKWLLTNRR